MPAQPTSEWRIQVDYLPSRRQFSLVQKCWMKKFRLEEGAKIAAQTAEPFLITTQRSQ